MHKNYEEKIQKSRPDSDQYWKTGHQMRASSESPPANASWICLAQAAITIIQAQLKLYMSEFALSKNAKKKSGKNE